MKTKVLSGYRAADLSLSLCLNMQKAGFFYDVAHIKIFKVYTYFAVKSKLYSKQIVSASGIWRSFSSLHEKCS